MVFTEFADSSPRFLVLRDATAAELDMQKDIYRLKSRPCKVVARRASLARSFFEDMRTCNWNWMQLTPFQVASCTRGRVSGGAASAAATAKLTLVLVECATEVSLFSSHLWLWASFLLRPRLRPRCSQLCRQKISILTL